MEEESAPKYYQSYIDLAQNPEIPDIPEETLKKLQDRGFSKFLISHEDPTVSVKLLAHVMRHSILKPQRVLVDDDDYYVAIDLVTNTYYICYRNLLMIDIDRYKQEGIDDALADIRSKLTNYPQYAFRIYESRNGYHLFVLNQGFDRKSDEAIRLMYEVGCDFFYIVYSYLRGWSVRLNRKQGEDSENLYTWVGDVVLGQWMPAHTFTGPEPEEKSPLPDPSVIQSLGHWAPTERMIALTDLHLQLTEVFREVGISMMPAPQ